MVMLPMLQEYVGEYPNRQSMLEVAFRFAKLGERLQGIDCSIAEFYSQTHFFLYESIMDGVRYANAAEIEVEFSEDLIPISDEQCCDDYIPAVSCMVNFYDEDGRFIDWEAEFFDKPLKLNVHNYKIFAGESCERIRKTANMWLDIDHFVLDNFAKYAYLLGAGMPLKDAIAARREEFQKRFPYLQ